MFRHITGAIINQQGVLSVAADHFEGVMMATRGLPDDGICEVPKHVGVWLTSDEHILYM